MHSTYLQLVKFIYRGYFELKWGSVLSPVSKSCGSWGLGKRRARKKVRNSGVQICCKNPLFAMKVATTKIWMGWVWSLWTERRLRCSKGVQSLLAKGPCSSASVSDTILWSLVAKHERQDPFPAGFFPSSNWHYKDRLHGFISSRTSHLQSNDSGESLTGRFENHTSPAHCLLITRRAMNEKCLKFQIKHTLQILLMKRKVYVPGYLFVSPERSLKQ